MPSTRVADVLAEVFRTYGFDTTTDAHPEGTSRTVHTLDLLAEKDGVDIAITIIEDDRAADLERIDAHNRLVHDIRATYGLVATTNGFTEAAIAHGARTRTILWDRAALETVIGRAVLHEILGPDAPELPIAEVLAVGPAPAPAEDDNDNTLLAADGFTLLDFPEPTPTYATPEPVAVATPAGPSYEEGRGWYLTTSNRPTTPEPVAPARPAAPAAPNRPGLAALAAMGGPSRIPRSRGPDPRVFNPPDGALLAPAVAKERAAAIAKDRIFTIDHTHLRYHPKRVYRWTVEAFVEGSVKTTTLSGVRLIDLATRRLEAPQEWTSSRSLREGTFDVPVDHKPVRLETERAESLVLDSVLEETAREITVEDHDSGYDVLITQKKKVRAHRDDVRLRDEGLHWCPVWCFTGVNGEVEVDGLTGVVVGETLKAGRGGAVLI